MKKSYLDLLKVYKMLNAEVQYLFDNYGIELRLMCGRENLILLKVDEDVFVKNLKNRIIDIFNLENYYSDETYGKYKFNILLEVDDKKIIELSKYFSSLSTVMYGEYSFSSKASDLFDDSINEICFDILGRAFLEARFLVMYSGNIDDDNLRNYIKLFEIYDSVGKEISNYNVLSKIKKLNVK